MNHRSDAGEDPAQQKAPQKAPQKTTPTGPGAPEPPQADLEVLQARADALRAAGRHREADMVMAWRDLHAGQSGGGQPGGGR
jgi:hypothetical protein